MKLQNDKKLKTSYVGKGKRKELPNAIKSCYSEFLFYKKKCYFMASHIVKHVVIYLCFKSVKFSSSFFLEGTYGILSNIIIQKNPHPGDFVCMCVREWSQGCKHIECILHTTELGSDQKNKIVKVYTKRCQILILRVNVWVQIIPANLLVSSRNKIYDCFFSIWGIRHTGVLKTVHSTLDGCMQD